MGGGGRWEVRESCLQILEMAGQAGSAGGHIVVGLTVTGSPLTSLY